MRHECVAVAPDLRADASARAGLDGERVRVMVVWPFPPGVAGTIGDLAWLWGRSRSETVETLLRAALSTDVSSREASP